MLGSLLFPSLDRICNTCKAGERGGRPPLPRWRGKGFGGGAGRGNCPLTHTHTLSPRLSEAHIHTHAHLQFTYTYTRTHSHTQASAPPAVPSSTTLPDPQRYTHNSNWRGTFTHVDIPRLPTTHTFTPLHIQTHTQPLDHRCRHTDSLKLCVNIYIHTHTHKPYTSTSLLRPNSPANSGNSDPSVRVPDDSLGRDKGKQVAILLRKGAGVSPGNWTLSRHVCLL